MCVCVCVCVCMCVYVYDVINVAEVNIDIHRVEREISTYREHWGVVAEGQAKACMCVCVCVCKDVK